MRKSITFGLTLLALALAAMACTPRVVQVITGTDRAAGADGRVTVERGDGGNFTVDIETQNLPPAERLGDGLTTFVVWFQAPEQQPTRMGALDYNEGNRSGEMHATTTHTAFDVIISAEAEATVPAPSDIVVFRTSIQAP